MSVIQGWQPIETAPKDGTEILMVQADGYLQVGEWAAWMQTPCWVIIDSQAGGVIEAEPTHWMPLPTPPWSESK